MRLVSNFPRACGTILARVFHICGSKATALESPLWTCHVCVFVQILRWVLCQSSSQAADLIDLLLVGG